MTALVQVPMQPYATFLGVNCTGADPDVAARQLGLGK